MTDGNIGDLEVLLGHVFRDKQFIFNALSHSSTKTDDRPSNERLEFLGDSVLGTICAEALYRRYPDADEGELTRIKSATVSRATLERVAMVMGLDRFILVGKGVRKKAIPSSLIGNLFEAIVGAIYLDAGLAATRKFVLRQLDVVMGEIVEDRAERNYKSMLQHYCQRELGGMPSYRVQREAGPAHSRNYEIAVVVKGEEVGRATAASKKEAEQGAARAALLHYKAIDEQPIETVRGAGTVLRVGPVKAKRKSRSRRGRRGDSAPADRVSAPADRASAPADRASAPADRDSTKSEKPAAETERADAPATGERGPGHTPKREGESSRRSRGGRRRRGGRGRGGRGRGGQGAAAQENSDANAGGNNDSRGADRAPRSDAPDRGRGQESRPAAREPERTAEQRSEQPSGESASAPRKKAAKKAAKKKAAKKTAKKKAAKKTAKKKAAKKTAKKTAKKAAKKKAAKKTARKPRGSTSSGDSASTDSGE